MNATLRVTDECTHPRTLMAVTFLLLAGAASASHARNINLPHTESFDGQSSLTDIAWATQGAAVTWEANGGWRGGGGIKVIASGLNDNQGYGGVGQFDFAAQNQLNVRFLINFGSTFAEQVQTDKLLIVLRQNMLYGFQRPMILDNWRLINNVPHRFWRACPGVGECGPVLPANEFTVSNGTNANQWVCFELETKLVDKRINLYIHTADGRYRGLTSSVDLVPNEEALTGLPATNFPINAIQILGGFWNWPDGRDGGVPYAQRDANAYIKLDELAVGNQYLGCPTGFLDNPPPAAPTNLRAN